MQRRGLVLGTIFICLVCITGVVIYITTSADVTPEPVPVEVDDFMKNIFKFWYTFRDPTNGLYCDNVSLQDDVACGHENQQYSSASVGWGLMANAIFAELNLVTKDHAMDMSRQTLETVLRHWPREFTFGFYQHFTTRDFTPISEYSTIDTALLQVGASFAGNYFGGDILEMSDVLFRGVDWGATIESSNVSAIYATVNDETKKMDTQTIRPYNEYYIVAYLAVLSESDAETKNKDYFETFWGTHSKPVGNGLNPTTISYAGNEVLSDSSVFLASFIPLFNYFGTKAIHKNQYYLEMADSWLGAEIEYWKTLDGRYEYLETWGTNVTGRVFGSSAGDCPQSDYCVLSVQGTERGDDTFSTAIMGGFLATADGEIREQINSDLQWMYNNDVCAYKKPFPDGTFAKILWRCSVDPDFSSWHANRPTGVDYATMLFGYATNWLPEGFYEKYNN